MQYSLFSICCRSRIASSLRLLRMASSLSTAHRASPERASELVENLKDVCLRVRQNYTLRQDSESSEPLLVAVSKYKPASDIAACYEQGQRDFGENYVQELVDKAKELPGDIKWHFIGAFQTNKSKLLASIPNLYTLQTLSSLKSADAINRALPADRESSPLNVLLQVNTSGEDSKSGLPPLTSNEGNSELIDLAKHIIERCPRLHLQGLMTIGSLSESLSDTEVNQDFEALKRTRDILQERLKSDYPNDVKVGSAKLVLSMGMSSDFETAIRNGSDIVRVGTGIFGARPKKG